MENNVFPGAGWEQPGFDDSGWNSPIDLGQQIHCLELLRVRKNLGSEYHEYCIFPPDILRSMVRIT